MLIVKTVLREFALAACNMKVENLLQNQFIKDCLSIVVYSFIVINSNKDYCNLKDIDMSITPIQKFIILTIRGKEGKFG